MVKVHDTCVGCGVCVSIAPTIFSLDSVPVVVIKQPDTSEENDLAKQAKTACPVWAIE